MRAVSNIPNRTKAGRRASGRALRGVKFLCNRSFVTHSVSGDYPWAYVVGDLAKDQAKAELGVVAEGDFRQDDSEKADLRGDLFEAILQSEVDGRRGRFRE